MKDITFLKVFFRSFFIQSSWSFERLQSLGFAAAISPALGEIYTEKNARAEALRRHLGHYNSHPYMASPVLGASINMEERARRGGLGTEAASEFKKAVMGPYGAIGDMFFWAAIRPLSSAIGILCVIFFGAWGMLGFLLFYNIFHLLMRWRGLGKGYELGEGVVEYIKGLRLPDWSKRAHVAGSIVLGAVYVLMLGPAARTDAGFSVSFAATGLVVAGLTLLIRKGAQALWLLGLALSLFMLYAALAG